MCVCFYHHYFFAVSPLPTQTVRSFITLPPLPLEDDFYFGNAETFLVPFLAVMTTLSLTTVVGLTVFMGYVTESRWRGLEEGAEQLAGSVETRGNRTIKNTTNEMMQG